MVLKLRPEASTDNLSKSGRAITGLFQNQNRLPPRTEAEIANGGNRHRDDPVSGRLILDHVSEVRQDERNILAVYGICQCNAWLYADATMSVEAPHLGVALGDSRENSAD